MQDHPAAHSMDSTWFAVDEDGHVAVFDTGEGGALPNTPGFPMGGEAGGRDPLEEADLVASLLLEVARGDPELRALLPADEADAAAALAHAWWELEFEEPWRLLAALGLFRYDCADQAAVPYTRMARVNRPITLDRLPAHIRARFADARLPVRFRDAPTLAPGEFVPVESWDQVWVDREGEVHPTASGKAASDPVEEYREWISEWREGLARWTEGEPATPEEVVAAVRAAAALPPPRPAGNNGGGGLVGWLKRLMGG